jgi:hypothetical protein
MRPPMVGTWQAEIVGVRPFQIHGDDYFELLISRLDTPPGDQPEAILRAPSHAFKRPPAEGQRVEIAFLMGQVTGVSAVDG